MILGKSNANSSQLLLSCNSSNIMRDNMLVKFGGHPMPINLNIEHLIGILKVFDHFQTLNVSFSHLESFSSLLRVFTQRRSDWATSLPLLISYKVSKMKLQML